MVSSGYFLPAFAFLLPWWLGMCVPCRAEIQFFCSFHCVAYFKQSRASQWREGFYEVIFLLLICCEMSVIWWVICWTIPKTVDSVSIIFYISAFFMWAIHCGRNSNEQSQQIYPMNSDILFLIYTNHWFIQIMRNCHISGTFTKRCFHPLWNVLTTTINPSLTRVLISVLFILIY